MFSVAVTAETFRSASAVSEFPLSVARTISLIYCGIAPATMARIARMVRTSAPLHASWVSTKQCVSSALGGGGGGYALAPSDAPYAYDGAGDCPSADVAVAAAATSPP